jgi:hypothetical protein
MKDLAYLSELKEDDLYHHYHPVLQHLSSNDDDDGDLASPADRDLFHSLLTRYHRETLREALEGQRELRERLEGQEQRLKEQERKMLVVMAMVEKMRLQQQ